MNPVKLEHLLSIESLSSEEILGILNTAQAFKKNIRTFRTGQPVYVSNLFFENSTRTHRSFEVAERRLGLEVIQFEPSTSSVSKGETLYDTILTMSALGIDICVIRHEQDAYYNELIGKANIKCSIINGGDGKGQHPTQCLLDLMTIQEEFNHFDGLKIAIVGDIRNSRVARSNAMVLSRLNAQVYFCGPENWYDTSFDAYGQSVELDSILQELDVVMLLRVQHERHEDQSFFNKEAYHKEFGLSVERASSMKDSAIIMHPAPVNRNVELADSLVEEKQSRIIQQMQNGVYVRMAVLEAILAYRAKL